MRPSDRSGEPDATVIRALGDLLERIADQPLFTEFDAAWRSPCELGTPGADGRVRWRPVPRGEYDSLDPLAETLELELHAAATAYYGHSWFEGLELRSTRGPVHLIGVWNDDDHDRLLQNLMGHLLQQRRHRARPSLFFATTEPESELILTIANDSGEVLLERPGTRKHEVVASSLADFLDDLRPTTGQTT